MARRPNYGQERAERNRKKAARREERLAAKTERSTKAKQERADGSPIDDGGPAADSAAEPASES